MPRRIASYGIIFTSLIFGACDDDVNPSLILNEYDAVYMLYPDGIIQEPNGNIVQLERDETGAVQKRTGGLINVPVATGYFFKFVPEVFDEVSHSLPQITITQKDVLDDLDVYPVERRVFLDENKRITKVIRRQVNDRYDTAFFIYQGDVLRTVVLRSINRIETRSFYYEDSNLIRIESVETNRFLDLRSTTTEIFDSYDTAPNPTKDLYFFEEVLYRSISRNNFSHYMMDKREASGRRIDSREIRWNLHYDENGIPTFR